MPHRKASAKLSQAPVLTIPGVSQPSAVARWGPRRPGVSVPRRKSPTSLNRLVPIWMKAAPSAAASSGSHRMACVSCQAMAVPTSTGDSDTDSVFGRQARNQAVVLFMDRRRGRRCDFTPQPSSCPWCRSRPGAGAPDHALGDEMAGRWAEVERQQAEAADQLERADVVGEGLDDLVGEKGAPLAVEATAAGVGVQRGGVQTLLEQQFGKLPGVTQAEVESLARDGVQRLCRVADPDFAAFDQRVAQAQRERETAALAGLGESHA